MDTLEAIIAHGLSVRRIPLEVVRITNVAIGVPCQSSSQLELFAI